MPQDNKTLVLKFFELLSKKQSLPEELLGSGFTYHVAGSDSLDLEGTRQRMKTFNAGFSGPRHIIGDIVADGDKVAFRSSLEMRHTGEFMGVAGSDEQISVVEMGFMRIANGKIAEMWGILDSMSLLRQIGAKT
jgi:predicted ester cyclase